MEIQILKDPMIKPETKVLEEVLGKNFKVYKDFIEKITVRNLLPEWNYYNDGKSWLCKILKKKKNLCWLSVWNTGFKLTFLFTEKTIDGIYKLEINNDLKEMAKKIKPKGKFIPVIILVRNKKVINDVIKILEYKMTLK